jgi:hypothetical protein
MSYLSISLRAFGYNMAFTDEDRHNSLKKAIDAHGVDKVIERLNELKVNIFYHEKAERDILYVSSIKTLPKEETTNTSNTNAQLIECIELLNVRLSKATLDKDYAMINLMVTSIANVINSTL